MEIIDDLEPTKRGVYGGVVGYLDFSGNLDTAIAIRTMTVAPDGRASVQAGAGSISSAAHETRFFRFAINDQGNACILRRRERRQDAVVALLSDYRPDVALVIGGYNSSNTCNLARMSAEGVPFFSYIPKSESSCISDNRN